MVGCPLTGGDLGLSVRASGRTDRRRRRPASTEPRSGSYAGAGGRLPGVEAGTRWPWPQGTCVAADVGDARRGADLVRRAAGAREADEHQWASWVTGAAADRAGPT